MSKEKEEVVELEQEKQEEEALEEIEAKDLGDTIEIDGEEYKIKFPAYSLIKLKNERGIELKDLQDEEVASDIETIVALIWAGLIHNDGAPTFDEVAKDIEISELQEAAEKVTQVINGSVKKD